MLVLWEGQILFLYFSAYICTTELLMEKECYL